MARSCFGITNYASRGSVTAGSEAAGMSAAQAWADDRGSSSAAWQTAAGVITVAAGAYAIINAGSDVTWRAFLLARTNLTNTAAIRWRVGSATALIEEVPLVTMPFRNGSIVNPSGYSFTRSGTTAYYFDSSGTLVQASANALRIEKDPITGDVYALLEEARTNSLRNPRGEGAVAGTPGTTPTNWGGSGSIVSKDQLASGTENGIPYASYRWYGTPGSSNFHQVHFETATNIAASVGQVWTISCFLKMSAGTLAGISNIQLYIIENDSGGSSLGTQTSSSISINTSSLNQGRVEFTATLAQATVAFIRPGFRITFTNGVASDITVRMSPQLELGSRASSPIYPPVSSPAATTRNVDNLKITGLNIPGANGVSAYIDYTAKTGTGSIIPWALTPASTNFTDSMYASQSAGPLLNVTLLDSVNGNWGTMTGNSVTDGSAVKSAFGESPTGGSHYVNNGTLRTMTAGAGYPGNYTTLALAGASWGGSAGNAQGLMRIRDFRLYTKRLTNGQLLQLSATGTSMDSTGVTYDSGTVIGHTIAQGIGQNLEVANADVVGQYCRVDITDGSNPDGFINVPLCYAGPLWIPSVGESWDSSEGSESRSDDAQSIGGQEYPIYRWTRRTKTISMKGIKNSEVWTGTSLVTGLRAIDNASRLGGNILYIPDTDDSDIRKETIFGRLTPLSDLAFVTSSKDVRSWRAIIKERL